MKNSLALKKPDDVVPKQSFGAPRLRDYQSSAAAEILAAKEKAVVLQLPTGGGKTHIAAWLVHKWRKEGKRVWFVCHRREILQQASVAFDAFGISHGVVAADTDVWPGWQVLVCSIETLRRRLKDLPAPDIIVWDECHHMAAKSWAALKSRFQSARHLGLTATPARLDGQGLSDFFDSLICGPATNDLIASGYLSDYRIFAPSIPDLRGLKMKMGDYNRAQLSERMEREVLVGDAIDHYKRSIRGGRAVVFATSVAASKAIAEKFSSAGVPAAHIDATTPVSARDQKVQDLVSGRIKVLSNVELFTEGFDLPAIDAVILLRPTKSLALYLQMIGRALRISPGKTKATIMDHAGLVYAHGMPDDSVSWSLDGTSIADRVKRNRRIRRCPQCFAIHRWSPLCDTCGHEYEVNDRDVESVYGDLIEIDRASWRNPPDGLVSHSEFARRIGVPNGRVRHYINRGLPTKGPFVIWEGAVEWINANIQDRKIAAPSDGVETPAEFARRIGINKMTVKAYIKRGMPTDEGGFVIPGPAEEWVKANPPRTSPNGRYDEIDGSVRRAVFAKRSGMTSGMLHSIIKKNPSFPIAKNGMIPFKEAMLWLSKRKRKSSTKEAYNLRDFANKINLDDAMVHYLFRHGLPRDDNGLVPLKAGLSWVKHNYLRKGESLPGYESVESFGKANNLSRYTVNKYANAGMPFIKRFGSGRLIHTFDAIEWIKNKRPKMTVSRTGIPKGYELQSDFCRRTGIRDSVLSGLIKRGLPVRLTHPRQPVHVNRGIAWLEKNYTPRPKAINGHERINDFIKRARIGKTAFYAFKRLGLPTHPKYPNMIPVERGMAWLRKMSRSQGCA